MNATLIISHCIIMLCDHCIFTYMSYLFLCVLCPGLRCYSISNPKFVLFFSLLLLCHREIESKLGPKKFGNFQPFKFCHWNLNSVLSEDCFKVSLLKAFNAFRNDDFTCSSKTFLLPSVNCTLDCLNIDGYNIVLSDHPSSSNRGAVSCYFKESFPSIRNPI